MAITPVWFWVALGMLSPSMLSADVTVVSKSDFQSLQPLPLGLSDQGFKPAQGLSPGLVRIKGTKCASSAGALTTITDLLTQEITLIDSTKRIFATIPMSEYPDKLAAAIASPTAAASSKVKMSAKTSLRRTGRTDTILGIQVEEREIILSVETEILAGGPQSGPLFKFVLLVWTAKPEEMSSNPALRELGAFSAVGNHFANPIEMLQKVVSTLTGTAEGMAAVVEEMGRVNSSVLRTEMEMYMPGLGAMAEKLAMQREQRVTGGFDPNAPFMRTTLRVIEISTAPLEDAMFQVPTEFVAAPAEELMKSLTRSTARVAR
jgi:hypothetical protein